MESNDAVHVVRCKNCRFKDRYKHSVYFCNRLKVNMFPEDYCSLGDEEPNGKNLFDIYQEGYQVMEVSKTACYVGTGYGETFLDACKEFLSRNPTAGEIKTDNNGNEYACWWACRWYPSLSEAQRSYG